MKVVFIVHTVYNNLEELTALFMGGTVSYCLLSVNVNWMEQMVRFFLSIGASLLSAYFVNKIKKYKEKK